MGGPELGSSDPARPQESGWPSSPCQESPSTLQRAEDRTGTASSTALSTRTPISWDFHKSQATEVQESDPNPPLRMGRLSP